LRGREGEGVAGEVRGRDGGLVARGDRGGEAAGEAGDAGRIAFQAGARDGGDRAGEGRGAVEDRVGKAGGAGGAGVGVDRVPDPRALAVDDGVGRLDAEAGDLVERAGRSGGKWPRRLRADRRDAQGRAPVEHALVGIDHGLATGRGGGEGEDGEDTGRALLEGLDAKGRAQGVAGADRPGPGDLVADVEPCVDGVVVEAEPGRPGEDQRPLEADRIDGVGDDALGGVEVEQRRRVITDPRGEGAEIALVDGVLDAREAIAVRDHLGRCRADHRENPPSQTRTAPVM
jgi:hypothetical protein